MDASLIIVLWLWLFLLFAIPSGIYYLYKESRSHNCCGSLVVAMSLVQIMMISGFVTFSLILFPVFSALFL